LGFSRYGINIEEMVNNVPKRIFRAWQEPWELEIVQENDPVNQARLLEKYGGMVWQDPDNGDQMLTASTTMLFFSKKRGDKGYCVKALKEAWTEEDTDEADTWEPWSLTQADDLYEQIVAYYRINPDQNIQIVTLQENAADATEENE